MKMNGRKKDDFDLIDEALTGRRIKSLKSTVMQQDLCDPK